MHNQGRYQIIVSVLLTIFAGGISDSRLATTPPIDCLDALTKCKNSSRCKKLMDAMPGKCGKSLRICNTSSAQIRHCRSILISLKTTHIFDNCTCTKGHPSFKECARINKTLTNHPCVNWSKSRSAKPSRAPFVLAITREPPTTPASRQPSKAIISNKKDHQNKGKSDVSKEHVIDDVDDTDEDDEDEAHPKSCIGSRKRCLQDEPCKQALTDFRRLCREKNNQCVFVEPEGCARAVTLLKPFDLFTCSCHMRKAKARNKCLRIQERLTNHTCVVSNATEDLDEIRDLPKRPDVDSADIGQEKTCSKAFSTCQSDKTCRQSMTAFNEACQWIRKKNRCLDRDHCLSKMAQFYEDVSPTLTHALLFCRCKDNDVTCAAKVGSLKPKCATHTYPQITCPDVIKQCMGSQTCKYKLRAYKESCEYHKLKGCVEPLSKCRAAKLGIMGTVLMTNCTCDGVPHSAGQYKECLSTRRLLTQNNICEGSKATQPELAHEEFQRNTVNKPVIPVTWTGKGGEVLSGGCREQLRERMPFMDIPSSVRFYFVNDSDCSEVCSCDNGTLMCKVLHCFKSRSCSVRGKVYVDGSEFLSAHRGQCRCVKGEVICVRSTKIKALKKSGIYLYLGFSKNEKREMETLIEFHTANLSQRLMSLDVKTNQKRECEMPLHDYDPVGGSLLFKVKVAENVNATYFKSARDGCLFMARILSNMVNTKRPSVTMDAQLSILKIAEVVIKRKPESEVAEEEKPPGKYSFNTIPPETVYFNSSKPLFRTQSSVLLFIILLAFTFLT